MTRSTAVTSGSNCIVFGRAVRLGGTPDFLGVSDRYMKGNKLMIGKNDPAKLMSINGLGCWVNTPPAPSGDGVHGLPPYCERTVHVVDEYPECPKHWMHGSSKASSYFLGVSPGQHLWLDFNGLWAHQHDVAIVLSVQGINPVTGQKTTALRLEQYREKCPTHDEPFGADRFCEKCKFKWPPQNYMTTTSTPQGLLWIDGWRTEAGKIRGFLITKEMIRGVAAQLIGEDRVFAIGVAFFLSKKSKPKQTVTRTRSNLGKTQNCSTASYMVPPQSHSEIIHKADYHQDWSYKADGPLIGNAAKSGSGGILRSRKSGPGGQSVRAASLQAFGSKELGFSGDVDHEALTSVEPTTLEIGAGAKIQQELTYFDNKQLDYYQDEPAGCIYLNYTDDKTCNKIVAAGRIAMQSEGFLGSLRVGN